MLEFECLWAAAARKLSGNVEDVEGEDSSVRSAPSASAVIREKEEEEEAIEGAFGRC